MLLTYLQKRGWISALKVSKVIFKQEGKKMLDKLFGEVNRLKAKAKKHYREYYAEAEAYDCGFSIAEVINPRMLRAKVAFNETMDKLAKLDPSCPKQRL